MQVGFCGCERERVEGESWCFGVRFFPTPTTFLPPQAGLDSLATVELRNAIADRYGVRLAATVAIDHPTIAALAAAVTAARGATAAAAAPVPRQAVALAPPISATVNTIVGTASRHPGDGGTATATTTAGAPFWQALASSCNVARRIPADRWDSDAHYAPTPKTFKAYVNAGGWLAGVDAFDGAAFRVGPAEAAAMDPQARVLLECVKVGEEGGRDGVREEERCESVEATDDSLPPPHTGSAHHRRLCRSPAARHGGGRRVRGLHVHRVPGQRAEGRGMDGESEREREERSKIEGGCFSPTSPPLPQPQSIADTAPAAVTGPGLSFLVGRVSYTFNLGGPCVSVDTACSSSLVAVGAAQAALTTHTAPAALAAGVNAQLTSVTTARICLLGALSPVGRCSALDASADGYGRGDGFGVVLVKRVDAAEAAASRHPIIHDVAIGHGATAASLTAPNGHAQRGLIARATGGEPLALASLHGTGTPLGDPIEVGALKDVGGASPVTLLASKSVFGHTEGAAGVTGVMAALAAASAAATPAISRLTTVNPHVGTVLDGWRGVGAPRALAAAPHLAPATARVGASSFGMSGVNAHAVVGVSGEVMGTQLPASPAPWHRSRAWPAPPRRALLVAATAAATFSLPPLTRTPAVASPTTSSAARPCCPRPPCLTRR